MSQNAYAIAQLFFFVMEVRVAMEGTYKKWDKIENIGSNLGHRDVANLSTGTLQN